MNYSEALSYIHKVSWLGSRPGLSRTRELLEKIGNPQNSLKFIHIAGTNGKGSTAAMLESILRRAGYKTGLYTSPFIETFNERMKVNGENIDDEKLAELTEYIMPYAEEMADHPTEFELITCLALKFFADENCDIVVFEAGMGGELDSTNVISTPELAIITSIGLDHTSFLGDTIEKIALTKSGIIKKNGFVVVHGAQKDVLEVFNKKAKDVCAKIYPAELDEIIVKNHSINGYVFDYKHYKDISLPLIGSYQTENAAVALKAIEVLKNKGFKIDDSSVYLGLKNVRWPARFEVLRRDPLFIVDGAHNPQGIDSTLKTLREIFPEKRYDIVFGVMADKDYMNMLREIKPFAKKLYCVTPDNPRALCANDLKASAEKATIEALAFNSVSQAVKAAYLSNNDVLAIGSLYMCADVRKTILFI